MPAGRRDFLRALSLAGVGGAGVISSSGVSSSGVAVAAHGDHKPDHVTLEHDGATLRRYRPRLDLSAVRANPDDGPPNGLYGWVARSPRRATDVAVYWAAYGDQDGLLSDGRDSHPGDHEPVYVAFSGERGEVVEVVSSAFHWLRRRSADPDRFRGTHPELTVVSPWHHYAPGTAVGGEFVELRDLTARYDSWLDGGLGDALEPGVVVDPWRMLGPDGRRHWWRGDGIDALTDRSAGRDRN